MRLKFLAYAAVCAVSSAPTHASTIDFTQAGLVGGTSFTATLTGGALDGATATFSNPVGDCYFPCAVPDSISNWTFNSSGGFWNSSGINTGLYDVVFSASVLWTGVSTLVQSALDPLIGIAISGPGVSTTVLAGLGGGATSALATPILFQAGSTYSFDVLNSVADDTYGGVVFASWTFAAPASTAIPLPAGLPLLVGGLGVLALFGRRRRRRPH